MISSIGAILKRQKIMKWKHHLTLPLQSYLLEILIEKTINLQTIRPLTLQFLVFVCLFLVYRHNNGYFSE